MSTKTSTRHRPTANPRYAREIHGLRSSNASGTHADRRTKRVRSRAAKKAAAIRDAS